MDRRQIYGAAARSPPPTDYAAAIDPAARPAPRAYGDYSYVKPGSGYGSAPTGSLRTTRSANTYARNDLPSSMRAQGPSSAHHGPQLGQPAYDGSRPAAYGAPAPPQHYQPPPQHLQPFVADDSERRTPDYLAGQAAEHAYRPPPSMPSGPVVTTYPEEYAAQKPLPGHAGYRRGSVASSKSGYGDAAARSTPTERYHSGARVAAPRPTAAAAAGSQYVEFGYTSPAMATLENSPPPEDDEIADIIADMTKTRITADGSPIRVFLQLGDDTKRVELADEPTHTTLVNLFIDKYRGRLADDPEALPAVYVKDRRAGVFYELEDMADVVDGAVLSWRTKPLAKGDGGGSAGDSSAEDAPKEQARDELAAVVAALAETVAQLPAKLKAEMASAAESAQGAMRAAAEAAAVAAAAAKAEEPASAAAEPQPAAAIARSASMPATGDTRDGSGLRRRAEKAEMELGVERQLRREADAEAAAEKARLAAELEKLRAEVGQHPNVLRARIEEGKAELRAKYRAFNAGFEDVDSMVQEMRKDVTQRGSIPSNQMVRKASTQLKEIVAGTQGLVAFINDTRADWKRTWEEELQNILKEQTFVKDVEQMLGELLDDTRHLDGVLDTLTKVIALKLRERAQDDYVPPAATRFIDVVAADDARDAKNDFLKQIVCVDIDHSRRVDALNAAERLRRQEIAAKVNEFDDELADFVTQRRLRKTGGTEELERRRAEKNIEVMREMLKSAEDAELARRAKIAQRKAAKKPASTKKPPPAADPVADPVAGEPAADPAADKPAAEGPSDDKPPSDQTDPGQPASPMQVDDDK